VLPQLEQIEIKVPKNKKMVNVVMLSEEEEEDE